MFLRFSFFAYFERILCISHQKDHFDALQLCVKITSILDISISFSSRIGTAVKLGDDFMPLSISFSEKNEGDMVQVQIWGIPSTRSSDCLKMEIRYNGVNGIRVILCSPPLKLYLTATRVMTLAMYMSLINSKLSFMESIVNTCSIPFSLEKWELFFYSCWL